MRFAKSSMLLRAALSKAEAHMWGVNCRWNVKHTEHVEFEIKIEDDEQFIVRRLREKNAVVCRENRRQPLPVRCRGFDTTEMLPWIRTFISRITRMSFSNRTAENKFKADIQEMCRMYGLDGGLCTMIFSELYSTYYNTVAKSWKQRLTSKQPRRICRCALWKKHFLRAS